MKTNTIKFFTIAFFAVAFYAGTNKGYAQRVIKIGQAQISVQSPITVIKQDTLDNSSCNFINFSNKVNSKRKYPKFYKDFFFGLGFAIPVDREDYMDIHYGRINTIEMGYKYFYRASRGYAIGTTFQYTYYNYKLKDAALQNLIVQNVPGDVKKEYFRTDNIGTGLINRFYLFPIKRNPFILDLGGYLDFAFSKRYNVKTVENGKTHKYKYRDGSKFNPLQAGLYGAITKGDYSLYVRYRLTNMFNPMEVELEVPKLSIGVQFNW